MPWSTQTCFAWTTQCFLRNTSRRKDDCKFWECSYVFFLCAALHYYSNQDMLKRVFLVHAFYRTWALYVNPSRALFLEVRSYNQSLFASSGCDGLFDFEIPLSSVKKPVSKFWMSTQMGCVWLRRTKASACSRLIMVISNERKDHWTACVSFFSRELHVSVPAQLRHVKTQTSGLTGQLQVQIWTWLKDLGSIQELLTFRGVLQFSTESREYQGY